MIKNVLIIEDKEPHMKALHRILEEIPNVKVFEAHNIAEAYCVLSFSQIHLFMVDIILDTDEVDDVSGLNFVRELRNNKNYKFTPVIFVTSLEDPKLLSYSELHCYGYVEKPFDKKMVHQLVCEALEFPVKVEEDKNLYFRKDGIIYSVNSKELVYIEVQNRELTIYTVNDKLVLPYKTLSKVTRELDGTIFIRCSKYVVFNKNYVEYVDISNRYIQLKGRKDSIEIGRAYTKEMKELFGND